MNVIDRRRFLRTSMLAAAGLSVPGLLEACAKKTPEPTPPRSLKEVIDSIRNAGAREDLQVFLAGEDYVVGQRNYLAFGLVLGTEGPVLGKIASVWVARGPAGEGPPSGPVDARWLPYTKPDAPPPAPQGVNAADLTFDAPGTWQMLVEVAVPGGLAYGTAALGIKPQDRPGAPIAGRKPIASETPTVDAKRGVDPICTRTPPCDFHRVTLAKALTLGKPAVFYVGTPRFCMSRTCGPNLEELIIVSKEVGDGATFVHAEVYKDDSSETVARQIVAPTFEEWGFQSEPWLFVIDRTGVIASRFEGPVTAPVVKEALVPLIG